MLEADTCGYLVVAGEQGEVVCDVRDLVLHAVVPSKQLVTRADIRFKNVGAVLVRVHDVDEGERRGVTSAHVLDISVREQQLVGDLVAEAAVQVGRPRLHLVVH